MRARALLAAVPALLLALCVWQVQAEAASVHHPDPPGYHHHHHHQPMATVTVTVTATATATVTVTVTAAPSSPADPRPSGLPGSCVILSGLDDPPVCPSSPTPSAPSSTPCNLTVPPQCSGNLVNGRP